MEKALQFNRSDFQGGMNRLDDSSKILENQYALAVNARTRYNDVEPIRSPLKQASGLPASGLFQGVYAAGSIELVFVAGRVYYKDFNAPASNYVQVVGLLMNASVANIFVEFVPSSTLNYTRLAGGNPNAAITLGVQTEGSLQCAVVQDGINQPWIIESNGTARVSQNYNEWTTVKREYIPIGRQMYYSGEGVLYVVSIDGSIIFRSVTGRPLDFVVAVNGAGDKDADALVTSHSVDFGAITCIRGLNTEAGAIFVSTAYRSYMVIPDFVDTIFGEPKFSNVPLFATGALNQFSFIELLGDNAFVTFAGMRSFNAVLQLKNEGKNAPFSAQISTFIAGIVQETSCAINSDDYAMFFVKTIYGDCILVFDTLKAQWVSIDKLSGITGIKQFAELKIQGVRKLFFITANGLYEYYGGTGYENAGFYLGDYVSGDAAIQHKPLSLHVAFSEPVQNGVVSASIFTDKKVGKTYTDYLKAVTAQVGQISFPFGIQTEDRLKIIDIDIGREKAGFKLGCYLTWAFNAKLTHAKFVSVTAENTEQQARLLTYASAYVIGIFASGVRLNSLADIAALAAGTQVEILGYDLQNFVFARFCNYEYDVVYIAGDDALTQYMLSLGGAPYNGQPGRLVFNWYPSNGETSIESVAAPCALVLITDTNEIVVTDVVLPPACGGMCLPVHETISVNCSSSSNWSQNGGMTSESCSICCDSILNMAIGDTTIITTCFTCMGWAYNDGAVYAVFSIIGGVSTSQTYQMVRRPDMDGSLTINNGCQFYELVRLT